MTAKLSEFTIYPYGWLERPDTVERMRAIFRWMEQFGIEADIRRHPVTNVLGARLPEPCADVLLIDGEHMTSDDTVRLLQSIERLMTLRTHAVERLIEQRSQPKA